jgi:serine/threonine protein kinase
MVCKHISDAESTPRRIVSATCTYCAAAAVVDQTCGSCGLPQSSASNIQRSSIADNVSLPGGTSLNRGRYRLLDIIGRGGFSMTYEGFDTVNNQPVAIKELFPLGSMRSTRQGLVLPASIAAGAPQAQASFLREAQVLQTIRHRNVVEVRDSFQENGTAYVVMELLRGEDYSALIARNGAFPLEEVEQFAREVGSGLHEAHLLGLVHRDVKPGNVMLTTSGRRVLIDFGAARTIGSQSQSLSRFVVTDGYSPPEQYGTSPVTPLADVYSLAATLYELATGHPPAPSSQLLVTGQTPTNPQKLRPDMPAAFASALLSGLSLAQKDRPPNILAFTHAITGAMYPSVRAPIAARTPRPVSAPTPVVAPVAIAPPAPVAPVVVNVVAQPQIPMQPMAAYGARYVVASSKQTPKRRKSSSGNPMLVVAFLIVTVLIVAAIVALLHG